MNTNTCKDCPCLERTENDSTYCHLDPPLLGKWPDVFESDWCYRGREVMEKLKLNIDPTTPWVCPACGGQRPAGRILLVLVLLAHGAWTAR